MQNNRNIHARRFFVLLSAIAGLILAGCSSPSVTNMTPSAIMTNPSQIYTITARVKPSASNVIPDSETVKIVIGGSAYAMTRNAVYNDIYEYDYKTPGGVAQIAYYFLVEYQVSNVGIVSSRTDYSALQHANILDRNSSGLSANRGPAGSRVAITGRGFTSGDNVYFDSTPVKATYDSPNSISFTVPQLEANRTYAVSMGSAPGAMPIGSFRIDPANSVTTVNTVSAPAGSTTGSGASYNTGGYTTTYSTTGATDGGTLSAGNSFGQPSYTTTTQSVAPAAVVTTSAPVSSSSTSYTTTSFGGAVAAPSQNITLTASPTEIRIHQGETMVIKFITSSIVSGNALLVDVTTDVPKSVIMPEVYVPPGSNVGTVTLQGGQPGTGMLYAKTASMAKPITIPITVQP